MTLKAKQVSALSLSLTGDIEAYFVQDGAEWNTLRAYRCISPAAFAGQLLVVAPDPGKSEFSVAFDKIFGRVLESTILMASPSLAAAIAEVVTATKNAPDGAA